MNIVIESLIQVIPIAIAVFIIWVIEGNKSRKVEKAIKELNILHTKTMDAIDFIEEYSDDIADRAYQKLIFQINALEGGKNGNNIQESQEPKQNCN